MTRQAIWEARWIFAALVVAWAVVAAVCLPLRWHGAFALCSVLAVALVLFTFYFFRDPERTPPVEADLAVSPADGVVVEVSEVTDERGEAVKRVGIFLSVFNVHINRSPVEGVVEASEEKVGEFLDARDPRCAEVNARRTWVIRGGGEHGCSVTVRQITGAIARRIVAWREVGDSLGRGERFGMIRFGSRTEVDFPASVEILVKKGDVVRGGETAVANCGTGSRADGAGGGTTTRLRDYATTADETDETEIAAAPLGVEPLSAICNPQPAIKQ